MILCPQFLLPLMRMNPGSTWIQKVLVYFFNIYYLSIWLHQVVAAACGIKFPDQESNPGPLHWEYTILATCLDHQGSLQKVLLKGQGAHQVRSEISGQRHLTTITQE